MQVKTDVSQFLTTDEQSDHLEKLYGKETLTQYTTLPIVAACFEDIRSSKQHSDMKKALERIQNGESDKEINKIIDSLKDVAMGPDGVPPRLWRMSEGEAREALVEMVKAAFSKDENTAKDCNDSSLNNVLVKWLHKKGPQNDPANYRTLGMNATARKVIVKVFLMLIQDCYLLFMPPLQGAFQPGIGSPTFARMTAAVIHAAKSAGLTLTICYIDAVKAYDRVPHSLLMDIFGDDGFALPKPMQRILKALYSKVNFVSTGATEDDVSFTEVFRGCIQGCCGSPLLFNCLMEYGRRCYEQQKDPSKNTQDKGFELAFRAEFAGHTHTFKITETMFADDLSILRLARTVESSLANNEAMGRAATEFMNVINARTGMKANYATAKSTASTYGPTLPPPEHPDQLPSVHDRVHIQGHWLPLDKVVKHLGRIHTEDGTDQADLDARRNRATYLFNSNRTLFTSRSYPPHKRLSWFFACIESTYTATSMTWAPTDAQWKKIDSWMMEHLRQVIGWVGKKHWRKTDQQVMAQIDKLQRRRYIPTSTKVRTQRINRVGSGAAKIYKALDAKEEPPISEMIMYATLDRPEGEACLERYDAQTEGLQPKGKIAAVWAGSSGTWGPVARNVPCPKCHPDAGKLTGHIGRHKTKISAKAQNQNQSLSSVRSQTMPSPLIPSKNRGTALHLGRHDDGPLGRQQVSWRAAAQPDLDSLGMRETKEQCYMKNGKKMATTWRKKAAALLDLPHCGTYTITAGGTIMRTRTKAAIAQSEMAKNRRKADAAAVLTRSRSRAAATKAMKAAARAKIKRRRQQKHTTALDRNGTAIYVDDIVKGCTKTHNNCTMTVEGFTSENRGQFSSTTGKIIRLKTTSVVLWKSAAKSQ